MIGLEWAFNTQELTKRGQLWDRSYYAGDFQFFFGVCAVGTIGLLILWLALLFGFIAHAQDVCARNGFPRATVTWNFRSYCSKRIFGGSDVVAPLHHVLQMEAIRNAKTK